MRTLNFGKPASDVETSGEIFAPRKTADKDKQIEDADENWDLQCIKWLALCVSHILCILLAYICKLKDKSNYKTC